MAGAATVRRPATTGPAALFGLLVLLAVSLVACTSTRASRVPIGHTEVGVASWYGPGFDGRRTASGETFDMDALTAAHRHLPFGTIVQVTNRDNGRRVELRINDRGPFVRGRLLDVSRGAAERLALIGTGTARVELRVVDRLPAPLPDDAVVVTGWLVQLGAFREPERAAALAQGAPEARVEQDGDWHRVVVGPFRKRDRAEHRARELQSRGYSPFVRAVYEDERAARKRHAALFREGSLVGLLGPSLGRPALPA